MEVHWMVSHPRNISVWPWYEETILFSMAMLFRNQSLNNKLSLVLFGQLIPHF